MQMYELPPPYVEFASPEEAHQWGLRQAPPHPQRPGYEVEALARYKGHCYKVVNAHLRGNRVALRRTLRSSMLRAYFQSGMEDDIQIIRDAMADASIDRHVVAWRGFSSPVVAAGLLTNVGGARFRDPGFVSTTFDHDLAMDWARRGGPGQVVLTVLVPQGAQAIYLENLAGAHQGHREVELLLLDNAAFRILHAEADSEAVTHGIIELLDEGSAAPARGV